MSTETELAELLAQSPPFDSLSPADRAGAVAAARIEEYQPGDLILDAFAAMPTASSAYVLAVRMGGHGGYTAGLVSLSTLIGMVALPAWLAVWRAWAPG